MDSFKKTYDHRDKWYARFPELHNIEVKKVGKTAACQSIKAILMQYRDHSGRLRRVWISFHGQQPTAEEQMLVWPSTTGAMRSCGRGSRVAGTMCLHISTDRDGLTS